MIATRQNVGISSGPITSGENKDLIATINELRHSLEDAGETNGTLEIFRKKLDHFYMKTVDPDFLRIHLYQLKVLTEYDNGIIEQISEKVSKCEKIYSYVFNKGAVEELIVALQKSGNDHIINLIRDIVRKKIESGNGIIDDGENIPANSTYFKNYDFSRYKPRDDRILQECEKMQAKLKVMENKNRFRHRTLLSKISGKVRNNNCY